MPTPISAKTFHEAQGVEDWRVLFSGACTLYRTGSFANGARLVGAIAEVASDLNHAPDVDLRPDAVTVRLMTHDLWSLSDADLTLAQRISVVASNLGFVADPSAVQHVQLAIDVASRPTVMPFWAAALGYRQAGEADLLDPRRSAAPIWFQDKAHRPPRNRIHVDVSVPHDQAKARIAAIVAAGGRMLGDRYAPAWWSLIDPEGNVVDVATWEGRD